MVAYEDEIIRQVRISDGAQHFLPHGKQNNLPFLPGQHVDAATAASPRFWQRRVFVLQDGLLQVRQAAASEWEAKCCAAQAQLRDRQGADACQAEASTAEVKIPA